MVYQVDFNVASLLCMLMLLILYYSSKQLKTSEKRCFQELLILLMISTVVDAFPAFFPRGFDCLPIGVNIVLSKFGNSIYFVNGVFIFLVLFRYWSFVIGQDSRKLTKVLIPLYLFYVAYIVMIVINLFNGCLFSISEEGVYTFGPLHILVYSSPYLSVCAASVYLIHNRKKLTTKQLISNIFLAICILVGGMVQAFWLPDRMIESFLITLAAVAIYASQQSPEYYESSVCGAFNRRGFSKVMQERMRSKRDYYILFFYVDEIERFEVTYGVEAQDQVVKAIYNVLPDKLRREMFYFVNKFAVLFDGEEEAVKYFHEIKDRITHIGEIGGFRFDPIIRGFLVCCPGSVKNVEELLALTHILHGKEFFHKDESELVIFDEKVFEKWARIQSIKSLLANAILNDGFEIYYQPIFDANEKKFTTAEALVRLKDTNTIGYVSPEEFIPIAEQENMIFEIETVILNKICRFLSEKKLMENGLKYIEINLSGKQCMQQELAHTLRDILAKYHLNPGCVNFEITETVGVRFEKTIFENIIEITKMGSSFSLDDYGSGYSNLQYLIDIPFRMVKIDKYILWNYFESNDQKTKAILPATIYMLLEMGLEIVAEGVETGEQAEFLSRMGVQYLQGYYYSKPVSEKDFYPLIAEQTA